MVFKHISPELCNVSAIYSSFISYISDSPPLLAHNSVKIKLVIFCQVCRITGLNKELFYCEKLM